MSDYRAFLESKFRFSNSLGIDVTPGAIHPLMKPHQRDIVEWAVRGGRRAIFAAFGLGKTFMQIETLRQIQPHAGGPALIVSPLGCRREFMDNAPRLGIDVQFIRSHDEMRAGQDFYLTNYESIRDGKLDPNRFAAASLDEASVLRSYGSKTFQEFLPLFNDVPFKFVATATPSPNRYKELIHYAGFLGVMDTGQALTRFFQRDSEKAGNLTLYPHMTREFFLWLHSWAIFLQKPSDLCRCACRNEQTSQDNASGALWSIPGSPAQSETALGSACATAGATTSSPPITSSPDESSVVDACTRDMAERERALTRSGAACVTDARVRSTKTGATTAAEASQCASAGSSSPTSLPTWESRQPARPLNATTTTAHTSPETADGLADLSKPETADHTAQGNSCKCDEGYELPPLDVRYHEVKVATLQGGADRDGQFKLIRDSAIGLADAATEKRESIEARVAAMRAIVDANPDDHFLLWHDLEAERHAISAALPAVTQVFGSLDLEERERRIADFSDGRVQYLATKPSISGSGCNFQRHCHRAIFLGIGYGFNDFIQSIYRLYRFMQPEQVRIDIIYTETEREILTVLQAKWAEDTALRARMGAIIREHGLSTAGLESELARTIGVERRVETGAHFTVAHNDCVAECKAMGTNSVDLIHTSIPFGNHYEYSPSYNDFGHNEDNVRFFEQMDFLTPELLRILQPGRVAAIHVKDRIRFGNVTGFGAPSVEPFHADCIAHYRRHGFIYFGMITVVTDVVRENNQTYRLGWSEQCKDGTKMGVGMPEYVLLFRKPQSDTSKGYADVPVTKSKADYTRARWQLDAHALWRSSGDRLLTPDEMASLGPEKLYQAFGRHSISTVYDHEATVTLGSALDAKGALPSTFMSLAPASHAEDVWHDVNRMRTLNGDQSSRNLTQHVCPLQFDIVDRIITRYTNPGELVFDPFGGLMTVPYRAIKLGRRGAASELNADYFRDGVRYLREIEREVDAPSLFDVLDEVESVAA